MLNRIFCCALLFLEAAQAQVAVLTGQYDVNRTSANLAETTLTASNVNGSQFGLLFSRAVDGDIRAQPLYVPNLSIQGATHNVVIVATAQNSVYAFDADAPSASAPLWQVSLGTPFAGGRLIFGILSTPVIDLSAGVLYAVTLTDENHTAVYRIHELFLTSGAEVVPSVIVQGSVPGTGDNSKRMACPPDGTIEPCVAFDPREELQRPSLLEYNGVIYAAFGTSYADESVNSYHGWVFGYAAGTLKQVAIFNASPNAGTITSTPPCSAELSLSYTPNSCGHGSGIWMSGRGLLADSGGIYLVTGNGGFGEGGNYGETVLRLNGAAQPQDSFTPEAWPVWNQQDLDYGTGGAILLPNTNLMITAGKTGVAFVLNRSNLGGLTVGDSGAVQEFHASPPCSPKAANAKGCYEIHNPAYWARTDTYPVFYVWAWDDVLRAYDFVDGKFVADPNPSGSISVLNFPGGQLAVSANGSTEGSGILWALVAVTSGTPSQAALYAFNASNITQELWVSSANPKDGSWNLSVFAIPTIANGKVYVPTASNQLRVYGLCSASVPCYPGAPAAK